MKKQAKYTELIAFKLTPEMRRQIESYARNQDRETSYVIRLAVSRLLNKKPVASGMANGQDTNDALSV